MTDERFKIWMSFSKFLLGTVALGVVTTLLNNKIQERELELKELEQLGSFVEHALQENVARRHLFAQYFATVTRSETLRDRWIRYLGIVEKDLEYTKDQIANNDSANIELEKALTSAQGQIIQLVNDKIKSEKDRKNEITKLTAIVEAIQRKQVKLDVDMIDLKRELEVTKTEETPRPPPDGVGTVIGRVSDETGESLPGVNVWIQDTANRATSNIEGEYRIQNVSTGNHQLRVSFVGYKTQLMTITVLKGQTVRNDFVLQEEALKALDIEAFLRGSKPVTKDSLNQNDAP